MGALDQIVDGLLKDPQAVLSDRRGGMNAYYECVLCGGGSGGEIDRFHITDHDEDCPVRFAHDWRQRTQEVA